MAWDRRGYFYRSRRVGNRVVRDYFGCGALAEFAEYLLEQARRGREQACSIAAGRRAALDAAEALFAAFAGQLDLVASGSLLAAGYHRHDRGPWRKRRGSRGGG